MAPFVFRAGCQREENIHFMITVSPFCLESLSLHPLFRAPQKEKSSFVESKIKEDQNRILNALKVNGYYFSDVKINIKRNDNNTVDIIRRN